MKVADIPIGGEVLTRYVVRASLPVGRCLPRPLGRFPRIEGWHRVRVIEVLPRGRVIIEDSYKTYREPHARELRRGFGEWFFNSKKVVVTVVRKYEVASRSLRPIGGESG
jgi:hypothetical protein